MDKNVRDEVLQLNAPIWFALDFHALLGDSCIHFFMGFEATPLE